VPKPIEQVLGESEQAALQRVLDRVQSYVEIETPSRDEAAIRKLASRIGQDLQAAGASVALTEAPGYGAHLVASFESKHKDEQHLVLMAHMDTVHPIGTIATQPFVVRDGRAEGPGIYDMKTGIALAVEAVHLLKRSGRERARPLRIVLTCDEEIGSHSALPIIEGNAKGAAAVLVPEPCITGGMVKTARKGVLTYRVDVTGRAAHAGVAPQTGVSAIVELARQMDRIYQLANPAVGTTVNVGVIGGGTASNVVPASAWAEVDVRVVAMDEGKRMHEALLALQPIMEGTAVSVRQTEQRPPLERTPAVVGLYQKARALAAELGHDMGEGASGGGSDGSLTAAMGVPTLDGLGADGGGAHAADEHILTADLPYRLALFTRILETF
jgi:glutamate carboxypeptidase